MSRALRILVGAMLAAATFLVAAPSIPAANAGACDYWVTPNNSYSSGTTTVRLQVQFKTQCDGSGVTLTGYWKDTTNGCGNLYSPPWKNERISFSNPETGTIYHTYEMGDEPCDDWNNLTDWVGRDVGSMRVNWCGTADKVLASNPRFCMEWTIKANGDSDLTYEGVL